MPKDFEDLAECIQTRLPGCEECTVTPNAPESDGVIDSYFGVGLTIEIRSKETRRVFSLLLDGREFSEEDTFQPGISIINPLDETAQTVKNTVTEFVYSGVD